MAQKNSDYEITKLGQFLAVTIAIGAVYVLSLIFGGESQESSINNQASQTGNSSVSSPTTNTKSPQQNRGQRRNVNTSKNSSHNLSTVKVAKKPNPKVVKYKEPQRKSAYVRKHHDIDVVKNTNYSQMAPLKKPSNVAEKWVIERIKKYQKDLPRILLEDYGDNGYYINTLGQDALGRYIIPGLNPDGEWATILYSNTNRKGKKFKMILGHNWGKWKDQGFYIHAIYVSNKTISLRNKSGSNLASSIYPVNQSLSKGPVFRF